MDIKDIKKLIDLAIKSDLAEFEYSEGETKVRIVRGMSPQFQIPFSAPTVITDQMRPQQLASPTGHSMASSSETVGETVKSEQYEQITSPMVGTFYRAPAPDADPFVDIGNTVNTDQTVCIIEAMKLMNEIKSEFKCRIIEILIENGHAVEFGQPLFKVEKL